MSKNLLVSAALTYADHGFAVFPVYGINRAGVCQCRKADCASPGKHPRTAGGHNDATCDPNRIRDWWERYPNSNVGICTGGASDLLVLDVDPKNGGDASFAALVSQHGALPITAAANTGGGGRHFYFKGVPGMRNSAGKVAAGLDIRADGGYVVAPPSLHVSGNRYAWQGDWEAAIELVGLSAVPGWLIALATGRDANSTWPTSVNDDPKDTRTPGNWWSVISDDVVEGSRNSTAARLTGYLFSHGHEPNVTFSIVKLWNEARCNPPLGQDEIVRVVESICLADMRKQGGK